MDNGKMYGIPEAAEILGISRVTVRRRVLDKTIPAVLVSRKEGYKISEEELNKYAETLKTNPYYANRKDEKNTVSKTKKKGQKAKQVSVETTEKADANSSKKSDIKKTKTAAKTIAVSNDTATEMLIGGQLGIALSAMLSAYSSEGEQSLPEDNVKNLIKELNRPTVIDKVIDRLKAEQEYYEIQMASLELEARQAVGKSAKDAAEQKLIEMKLKKNQIGKDITDLEIRKTLLG